MIYEGWPNLQLQCPVCGFKNCAVYKGYYQRIYVCPEMEHFGSLTIRNGWCKNTNKRFALIPDFLIPRRRISKFGHELLLERYKIHKPKLQNAIDDWMEGLGDEFYLPLSTSRNYLKIQSSFPP